VEVNISNKKAHFERTVRAYSADLYRYAYWLCRDRFVAEELVQEMFARAWKSWAELRVPGSAKPWLIAILRNERARMFARKQIPIADEDVSELEIPAEIPTMAENLDVKRQLERLPLPYREPLLLQVLGGFSCAEIASMLDTSEGAIMTRLTRARQAMRLDHTIFARRRVKK
jgi:RNA polymerase sigma-70 factor (ECF subfamily)